MALKFQETSEGFKDGDKCNQNPFKEKFINPEPLEIHTIDVAKFEEEGLKLVEKIFNGTRG